MAVIYIVVVGYMFDLVFVLLFVLFFFFFFFQAEDGIRDRNVTGVQTCALPIYAFRTILSGRHASGWLAQDVAVIEHKVCGRTSSSGIPSPPSSTWPSWL